MSANDTQVGGDHYRRKERALRFLGSSLSAKSAKDVEKL